MYFLYTCVFIIAQESEMPDALVAMFANRRAIATAEVQWEERNRLSHFIPNEYLHYTSLFANGDIAVFELGTDDGINAFAPDGTPASMPINWLSTPTEGWRYLEDRVRAEHWTQNPRSDVSAPDPRAIGLFSARIAIT